MAETLIQLIEKAADKYNVPREYVKAIAQIESGLNPKAVSPKGAIGVMQLMPETARGLGVRNPYDPNQNIDAGTRYFAQQLERFQNPMLAAAAYNSGPGNVSKYGGIPPFAETQDYTRKFNEAIGGQGTMDNQNIENSSLAQILASLNGGGQNQANIDPSAFVKPVNQSPIVDNFNRAMAAIATLGGTGASIIGGVRGVPTQGGQAVEAGLGLTQQLAKQQQSQQNQQLVNSLLQNPNLPSNVRSAIGLSSAGIPDSIVKQLTPNNADQLREAVLIKKGLQDINENTPEGKQSKLQNELLKKQLEQQISLQAQKDLVDYKAAVESKDPLKVGDAAMKLRKEFNDFPIVKDYYELRSWNAKIEPVWAAYQKNPNDFQSKVFLDQFLINAFSKIVDPKSVVRESEYARTPEGIALVNRVPGWLEKLQGGGAGITDVERKELIKAVTLLTQGQEKEYQKVVKQYKDEALRSNISPERVVNDLLANPTKTETPNTSTATPKKEELRKKYSY